MEDLRRYERALAESWRRLARVVEGGESADFDGITVALTHIPDAEVNSSVLQAEPEDPEGALEAASSWCAARGESFSLDLVRGAHPAVEQVAAARGMRELVKRPGMTRPVAGISVDPPGGLDIHEVRERRELEDVWDTQIAAFGFRREVAERFLAPAMIGDCAGRTYVAYVNGKVVGSATAADVEDVVGIFGVATLPQARRRGIGSALTARAMQDAAPAVEHAFLQATGDGFGLYRSMGFRVLGEWVVLGD
jgi:GNAT superfamily N-acetyltransferase